MFVGWRITGWATSFFVMLTIRTQSGMSPNSDIPNWVCDFTPIFTVVLFGVGFWHQPGFVCTCSVLFMKDSEMLVLHRSTGVAAPRTFASSLPAGSPHHMHATAPSCGDVLQVELEEDCTNLRALMLRFDSELELESHELGRSLLFMVRDDGVGFENVPRHVPLAEPANPFELVRERLAAAGTAIRGLHQKVHLGP